MCHVVSATTRSQLYMRVAGKLGCYNAGKLERDLSFEPSSVPASQLSSTFNLGILCC